MRTMQSLAPAKINVYLRIVGRRPDGYHLLDSLMVPISLYDDVHIAVASSAQRATSPRAAPGFAARCAPCATVMWMSSYRLIGTIKESRRW